MSGALESSHLTFAIKRRSPGSVTERDRIKLCWISFLFYAEISNFLNKGSGRNLHFLTVSPQSPVSCSSASFSSLSSTRGFDFELGSGFCRWWAKSWGCASLLRCRFLLLFFNKFLLFCPVILLGIKNTCHLTLKICSRLKLCLD